MKFLTIILILIMSETTTAKPLSKNALSVSQLYRTKFDCFNFDGEWAEAFGMPEKNKPWFVMAPVNSGKSTFMAQLCKYLSRFARVAYNSVEEGKSASLREAFRRANITSDDKILILDKEEFPELTERLKKHRSPEIIVLDTIQHMDINKPQYKELKRMFPKKLFIVVSHMDGNMPEGRLAKFCHQDASIKIRIEGFKAFPSSRYGGNKPLVIWAEGADKYHMGQL